MKANKILFGLLISGLGFAGLTQSCVSDAPFADGDGEGNLRLQLMVNSDLTRAELDQDQLMDGCVVYISNSKGLLYKYKGADEIPTSLQLKYGQYTAEAWAGDSVPASFIHRFFRGYAPFTIDNSGLTTVQVTCKIANVAVKVDRNSITPEMLTDWKVTVSNSSGSLEYTADTDPDSIGYFMMPKADMVFEGETPVKGDDGWQLYTNLAYTVEGTALDGSSFKSTGLIGSDKFDDGKFVEHAHLYTLSFAYNPDYEAQGGSFIEIRINDEQIEVREEVGLYSRPSVKGANFDITKQLVGNEALFSEAAIVKVAGFNGIESILLTSENPEISEVLGGGVDLMKMAPDRVEGFRQESGITWDYVAKDSDKASTSFVQFTPDFLNRLLEGAYEINMHVEDGNGRFNDAVIKIAVGEGAIIIEDPVIVDEIIPSQNYLAVGAKTATITGRIVNEEAQEVKLKYRKATGSEPWTSIDIVPSRSSDEFSIELTGLEPSTRYEYKVSTSDFDSDSYFFTTETPYTIPNGDMELWSTYGSKNLPFPGTGSAATYWDTGNKGAATVGTKILTQGSNEMIHGGSMAARLQTQSIIGQLAAGNLFVGEFKAVAGLGASLDFGRPYDGNSHPKALSVWANYRPKTISKNSDHLNKGDNDQAQIYIAIATQAAPINTSSKQYFNPEANYILGYGEVTWDHDFGPDGKLEQVTIPIVWNERAKTTKPTHLIIVCSASKYGDYLEGAEGSLMYLDDFELVY